MATSKYLRWLKTDDLQTEVAKKFITFCKEDIDTRSKQEGFEADIYEDAVKLIIEKLEGKDEQPEEENQG